MKGLEKRELNLRNGNKGYTNMNQMKEDIDEKISIINSILQKGNGEKSNYFISNIISQLLQIDKKDYRYGRAKRVCNQYLDKQIQKMNDIGIYRDNESIKRASEILSINFEYMSPEYKKRILEAYKKQIFSDIRTLEQANTIEHILQDMSDIKTIETCKMLIELATDGGKKYSLGPFSMQIICNSLKSIIEDNKRIRISKDMKKRIYETFSPLVNYSQDKMMAGAGDVRKNSILLLNKLFLGDNKSLVIKRDLIGGVQKTSYRNEIIKIIREKLAKPEYHIGVRVTVYEIAAKIGDKSLVEPLLNSLKKEIESAYGEWRYTKYSREQIVSTITEVVMKNRIPKMQKDEIVDALYELYKIETDEDIGKEIIKSLTKIGTERAMIDLIRIAELGSLDGEMQNAEEIKKEAIESLGKLVDMKKINRKTIYFDWLAKTLIEIKDKLGVNENAEIAIDVLRKMRVTKNDLRRYSEKVNRLNYRFVIPPR